MTALQKKPPAPAQSTQPAPAAATSGRKPWVRRSPVEVFLDQIRKQEERVAELQEQLNREKRGLEKLQKAKEILEAT